MQTMTRQHAGSRRSEDHEPTGMDHRVSVSLTSSQYKTLMRLAKEKKVSLAWVIRDAVDRLVSSDAARRRRGRA